MKRLKSVQNTQSVDKHSKIRVKLKRVIDYRRDAMPDNLHKKIQDKVGQRIFRPSATTTFLVYKMT